MRTSDISQTRRIWRSKSSMIGFVITLRRYAVTNTKYTLMLKTQCGCDLSCISLIDTKITQGYVLQGNETCLRVQWS